MIMYGNAMIGNWDGIWIHEMLIWKLRYEMKILTGGYSSIVNNLGETPSVSPFELLNLK